ncbi:MAG: hypothetical protein KIH69_019425, partial [Anaerolineae bacterium]|nr:hypothetical protein [Anaerolineae bacterium]
MAGNGDGLNYSLTQTQRKPGKAAPNPSRTADDGPPPDCSDCYPSTGPDGNVVWTPRPGDGGSSGGGGDPGGGSSGGGSSGGSGDSSGGSSGGSSGSSGGGSSGGSSSGVDNYEPPPYVEAPASSYPYEAYTPPASDPVYETYQSQDTA